MMMSDLVDNEPVYSLLPQIMIYFFSRNCFVVFGSKKGKKMQKKYNEICLGVTDCTKPTIISLYIIEVMPSLMGFVVGLCLLQSIH